MGIFLIQHVEKGIYIKNPGQETFILGGIDRFTVPPKTNPSSSLIYPELAKRACQESGGSPFGVRSFFGFLLKSPSRP